MRPLGGGGESDVDVRVIAATNKNLETGIAEGRFREDLYYRLSVIPIHLPPLREAREDIPLLARTFLDRYSKSPSSTSRLRASSQEAVRRLEVYDWPGNVRELENTLERAVALETRKTDLARKHPRTDHQLLSRVPLQRAPGIKCFTDSGRRRGPRKSHQCDEKSPYLLAALERAGGVRVRAADLLKMTYRSFRHYAKKHGV